MMKSPDTRSWDFLCKANDQPLRRGYNSYFLFPLKKGFKTFFSIYFGFDNVLVPL